MKIKKIKSIMLIEYEDFPIEIKIDEMNPTDKQAKELLRFHANNLLKEADRTHLSFKEYRATIGKKK